jgi:signal transduction histidine kinase
MFHSARLKLTAWYLLIIMLISGAFSLVIYGGVTFDLERRFQSIERRIRLERHIFRMPPGPPPYFIEDLQAAKRRVLFMLLSANGVILVLSSAAGYFLAGKTLRPIEEALEEQKRFLSDASHELRTPLTALKTSIEVALRDKKITKKEAYEVLQSSLEEVDSLQSLTSDLLGLAQHQRANGNFTFDQVNIRRVLEKAHKKIYSLAKKKSIDLEINADDIILEADETNLEKLMVILLDNAIKYTPKKGKVITHPIKGWLDGCEPSQRRPI